MIERKQFLQPFIARFDIVANRTRVYIGLMGEDMHEVSLGGVLRDYLTGEELENTTYEEIRQALAKLLVEEKGYPRERINSKVKLEYSIDGQVYNRTIDFVIVDNNKRPLLVIVFCSGNVGTYERETACAARLVQGGPAPYALATDTMEFVLIDTQSGNRVRQGMEALPSWKDLLEMTKDFEVQPLNNEDREKQVRIFHAYSGFLFGVCCEGACPVAGPKKD